MESILTSIKKLLGPTEEDTSFDVDITIHINTAFSRLRQLGVGPAEGFRIIDKKDEWGDFIGDSETLENVKTYIYLKTKLVFDPPSNSAVLESMKQQIAELEWLLNVDNDTTE